MTAVSSITSLTLDLPPSCIQFSPRHPELFVVGTYFLHGKEQQGRLSTDITQSRSDAAGANDEGPSDDSADPTTAPSQAQKRTGSLILLQLENDQITQLSTTATDFAILDIQWAIHSDTLGDVLAVATSTGLLAFYHLRVSAESSELVPSSLHAIAEPEILVLSLTWHHTQAHVLGVTLSDGSVQLCESTQGRPGEQGELWGQNAVLRTTQIHSHALEAWTLAFAPGETTKVLSGGDDVALQCSRVDDTNDFALLWRDRNLHEAGVTAILPLSETLVVTGSYDDYIRLISTPTVGRRQVLAELNLGGGVWRVKVLHVAGVVAGAGEAEGATIAGTADPDPDPDPDPTPASSSSPSALSSADVTPTRSVPCRLPLPAPSSAAPCRARAQGTWPTPTPPWPQADIPNPLHSTRGIILLCSCMHAGSRIVSLTQDPHDAAGWTWEVLGTFEEHRSMNYGSDVQPGTGRVVSTSFYDKFMCLWRVDGGAGEFVM